MAKKSLEIDMIAGSQLRDTQGEMLSVEGADISDLEAGRGRLNDNHGKGFFNSIGRITGAKKIMKAEDCSDPRHQYYWDKVKAPFIYVKGYLYNDEDHQNAKAAAAILRNIHKDDAPLKLKASVEGGVISRGIRDQTLLARTKIHSVALTFTPANNATLVEPLSLDKSAPEPGDDELIKSVMHLAQDNVPSFRHIVRHGSANKVHKNLHKISEIVKNLKGEESTIDIPSPTAILEAAMEAKIRKNVEKIKETVDLMKQEDVEKGVKEAVMGAALAGGMAMAPAKAKDAVSAPAKPPIVQQKQITHEDIASGLKKKNPNLWALSRMESSGGRNLAHEVITSDESMHKGHKAGGPWGMMPKTVKYVSGLSKKLQAKYPELSEKLADVENNHEDITKFMNENPQAAYDYARALYNHIDKNFKGDANKIAHAWHYGINGTHKALKENQDIGSTDYVSKFNNLLKFGNKEGKVEKALTAGYGGAEAPTSRVNGAVIQSEALDDGRLPGMRGFKYVTCDNCGDEQVYSQHQVKCRKCKKSFSLEKLLRFMGR